MKPGAENLAGGPGAQALAARCSPGSSSVSLVDPEHHHERLKHHPVHAEREQDEDRLDDDQADQAAPNPPVLQDDEDAQADERDPDGEQDVEDLDDLRRDQRGEAEVEQRAEEALLAVRLLRLLSALGCTPASRLPLRRRRRRALAWLGPVALVRAGSPDSPGSPGSGPARRLVLGLVRAAGIPGPGGCRPARERRRPAAAPAPASAAGASGRVCRKAAARRDGPASGPVLPARLKGGFWRLTGHAVSLGLSLRFGSRYPAGRSGAMSSATYRLPSGIRNAGAIVVVGR